MAEFAKLFRHPYQYSSFLIMRHFHLFFIFLLSNLLTFHAIAVDSKGAIIIASMEGQVSVKNNESGTLLSADRVKVGGMIFDGHTVETGKGSKVVLLFSSGTITTLKEDSVLNIKKFAQQKFDPKAVGKLSARADEPSPSETVIDLNLGDMVVDVKKLKKESSFNIDSPVGTAGIRGTIPRMKVVQLPDGTINQTTQMLKGQISYMPKGGGRPTMLGPGQSLASGISASGMTLPIKIGRVPAAVMKAIQAEVDQASAATGKATEGPPPADTPESNPEDEAPEEDELNESDDERQASAKGVGDDENGTEAVALEKAGILDLENPEDAAKADTYVEVAGTAAEMLDQKKAERRAGRRSSDSDKDETNFVSDLVSNFGNVVDVTEESEALGLKDSSKISAFAESSDQSGDLLAVLGDANDIGAKNAENMDAVFSNPDKASNLKKVIDVAKDAFTSGRRNSDGDDEVTQDGKDTMTAMFRTAEKADEVAQVVASAETTKETDSEQGEKKVLGVFKVVKSVDKAEQDKKAAEEAAAQAAAEAAAKKAAEEAAAQKAAEEAAEAAEAARLLEEQLASASAEQQAQIQAELDAARLAAEEKRLAEELATKKKAATDDYSEKLQAIKAAADSANVDALVTEFTNAHDAEIVATLTSDGLDLSANAEARRVAIKAEASAAQKENVFGNLETVSDLAVASIEVEEQAAAEAAAAEAKKLASTDYQAKLAEIEAAQSITDIDALVAAFNDTHSEANRDGLDLSTLADAQKEILSASESEREAKLAAAAAAKAEAEARAQAKAAAAERAKAEAEAKAADTGFDNMIENADQATALKEMVDKNAEIEAAAAAKQAATADYQAKLEAIENAETTADIDALISAFNEAHLAEYITGLDLTTLANAQKDILTADESERAAKQAAAAAAKAEADAAALAAKAEADAAAENKADLGSLLKNADKAEDLKKVVDAAQSLSSGDSSTLTALLKNPDQAEKLAEVVESSSTGGGDGEGEAVQDTAKLNVLFNVVKSSDAKKVAAEKQAAEAEAAGAFVSFEVEELILAAEDKATLNGWRSSGNVDGEEFSGESLSLLQNLIDNRIEEINSKNVFEKIDTVVEVAKSVQDNGGGSDLDNILNNADKADDLKVLVDKAVESGGADGGAATLLTNVLDNAEKATELSEVVSSAADEGVDVTQFLENANEADSLLKAKQAADAVELDAAKKKAIELAPEQTEAITASQTITELEAILANLEDIAAQVEAAKKAAKKEVMETVAANAANAESVATVLEAAEGADAETKAALLRNADQAVAMANTIREEEAIKKAAEDKAAEEAAAAEAAAQALEQQLASASAEEQAAIQAEIEAVRLAAEQRRLAEEQFTEDLRTATSLAQVDEALNTYKLILDDGEEVPETISNFVTSRKKNLSIISVAKQMDTKKQEAKAVAARAEQASVSTEFREAAQTKESISELKTLLSDNLPDAITDSDLKTKIFRAKTEDKVRELLVDYDPGITNSAVDHWMIVFPVKEEINAALAFASIEVMAEVAASTAAVAEVVVVDDGLSQEAQDAISQAQEDLDFAETIDEVDAILSSLESLEISIPDGITSFAESKKKSITALNAVLDNAEQAAQVAVLLESEDSGSEGGIFDSLSSGGDDFDFDEVIASGALGTLQGQRFEDLSLNFEEFYSVDSSNQQTVQIDTVTSLGDLDEQYLADVQNINDAEGGNVYQLTAEQVNTLTGSADAVAGVYSFSEILDPDTGLATGVAISAATKKLGVTDTASEGAQDYTSFAVEPDRAGDVLFILDSPAIKILETDSPEEIAKKDDLRNEFLQNSDQLDNLLELNKVIGEDQNKVEIAFANIGSLDDLVALSDKLKFDEVKLNQIYDHLNNADVDDATKSANLSHYRSLTEKLFSSPKKLNAVFENVDKLEVLDDLTNRLDRNVEGLVEEKGQLNFLFNNLDKSEDLLSIVNRFEGVKRDTVLRDIRSLVTTNPTHRDIIFANPSQASSLTKLYEEFKYEPSRIEVIFQFADKADAFLDVLNDLKQSGSTVQPLFTDPEGTMADTGFVKLINEYDQKYHQIFEDNKEIAAEISATASKFKDNPEFLDLVFANLDKLDDVNDFANEFGGLETVVIPKLDDNGNPELDGNGQEQTEEKEIFVYDEQLMHIFFKNISDLDALYAFKEVGELVGIPGFSSLEIFDTDPSWLEFVIGNESTTRDEEGRLLLTENQKKAARFLGDLHASDVAVVEIPLPLAEELFALGLSSEELKRVITDLSEGPIAENPDSQPPGGDDLHASADLQTLTFLLDHSFTGSIDPNLIVSAEVAMASSFFSESMAVFEELSFLGQSQDDYAPADGDEIIDPGEDGSFTAPEYDGSTDPNYDGTDPNYVDDGSTDDRRVGDTTSEADPTDPSDPNYDSTYPDYDTSDPELASEESLDGSTDPNYDPNHDGTDPNYVDDTDEYGTDPNYADNGSTDPNYDPNHDGTDPNYADDGSTDQTTIQTTTVLIQTMQMMEVRIQTTIQTTTVLIQTM